MAEYPIALRGLREWSGYLLVVSLLLVSGYHLPEPIKYHLVFQYEDPTVLTAVTANFIHLSWSHLLTNLLAFGLLSSLGYSLAILGGRRDLFIAASVTVLVAFPPVLSWLNLAVARPRVGFGFSGLVMAFLGLLALMVGVAVDQRWPGSEGLARSPGLFLGGLAVIAWLAVPTPRLRLGLTAVAGLAALGFLWGRRSPDRRLARRWVVDDPASGVVLSGVVCVVVVPVAAFPTDPVSGGAVVNLYSHLLGYCLGFIVPYSAVHLLEWTPDVGFQLRASMDWSRAKQ